MMNKLWITTPSGFRKTYSLRIEHEDEVVVQKFKEVVLNEGSEFKPVVQRQESNKCYIEFYNSHEEGFDDKMIAFAERIAKVVEMEIDID